MAVVMVKHFPEIPATVYVHDDDLIKDEEEVKRRLTVCENILSEALGCKATITKRKTAETA